MLFQAEVRRWRPTFGRIDDANIDHRGFAGLVQCSGVDHRVGFIGVDPIIVHRDVKIPIFDGSVRSKPVGQFGAFTVIVELFEFDLNLDVIVLTHIRFAFNRERIACEVKRLIDGSGHGDIFAKSIAAWRRRVTMMSSLSSSGVQALSRT